MDINETPNNDDGHSLPPRNDEQFDGLLAPMDGPPPPIRTNGATCDQCDWAVADVLFLPCLHVALCKLCTLQNEIELLLSKCSSGLPVCPRCETLTRERIFLKLATSTCNHRYYESVRRAQFVLSRLLDHKLDLYTRVEYPLITSKVDADKYEHMEREQLHALIRNEMKNYDARTAEIDGAQIVIG